MSERVIYKPTFPILGVLGLIFITLKLTGHIAWSWWWVLAPFWIPIGVAFSLLAIAGVLLVIARIMEGKR